MWVSSLHRPVGIDDSRQPKRHKVGAELHHLRGLHWSPHTPGGDDRHVGGDGGPNHVERVVCGVAARACKSVSERKMQVVNAVLGEHGTGVGRLGEEDAVALILR